MTQPTVDQLVQAALHHHQAGRLVEAESIYRSILAARPDNVDALHLLGVLAGQVGHQDAAIELLNRAIELQPNFAEVHNNLGNLFKEMGRADEAFAAYKRAIDLKPEFADAHSNIGVILKDRGKLDEAIAEYELAIRLQPDFAGAYSNLGNALRESQRLDEAKQILQRAIEINPGFATAHNNLGSVLRDQRLSAEAISEFNHAIQLKPDYAEAHANLGLALGDLLRVDEAIASYERAIALKPEFPDPHWNLSQSLLLKGDFARGWREYEWRWKVASLGAANRFAGPQWDGRDLPGRTILLYSEQGLGDTIQFIRYAPMVAARGGKVVLECPVELLRLFEGFPGIDRLIPLGEPLPPFDFHSALASLPGVFATDMNSIPTGIPYLHADEKLVAKWKSRMGPSRGRKKIGLVWAGRPGHKNDINRSMTLAQFAPLKQVDGVDFYSLQKGEASPQARSAGLNLIDWTNDIHDLHETAALISNLDLVITVDTSVAHLAGAMGKPAWVMIPFVPDWRWMLDRHDSPWYPTIRLFRQPRIGDWASVIQSVVSQLQSAGES